MSNNQNNPQEAPQVKSVEEYYPGIQYQEFFNHMSNEHGLTLLQSEMDEIISLCDSMGSNQRIEELEKENAVYMEALEKIANIKDVHNNGNTETGYMVIALFMRKQAEQALNNKDND